MGCIFKCKLKLYHPIWKPYINNFLKIHDFPGPELIRDGLNWLMEKCAVVWGVPISDCLWKSWTPCPSGQRAKGPSRVWPMQILKPASVKLWVCAHGSGNLHVCEGTINVEKVHTGFWATYAAIQITSFSGTSHLITERQCPASFPTCCKSMDL